MAKQKIKAVTDQRPFIMIYHDFLESDMLNTYEKIVFIALKKFADSKNQCFPSLNKLSSVCGLSKRKVQDTLKELENKHIITTESRLKTDGGTTSNLYTLYDLKEIWGVNSSEDIKTVAKEISEMKLVADLEARGYTVIKEKRLNTEPTKAQYQVPKNSNLYNKNTIKKEKSQEKYTIEQVQIFYNYKIMINDRPFCKDNIDAVINILYDTLNTEKETIRIQGEDKPATIVISKLMKLDYEHIFYVIDKFNEQTERVKNPTSYMLTLLYKAKEQMNLDITNQVKHDMYNWNPQTKCDYE